MSTELQAKLEAPFGPKDLEWKVQKCGVRSDGEIWALVVPYIDARAGQRRLDSVFGMDGWGVTYREIPMGEKLVKARDGQPALKRQVVGVLASIRFRLPGGEWVVREDGAEATDIEPVKGGISGAFKRAAVTLGIGRYLYDVDACWAQIVNDRKTPGAKAGVAYDKQKNAHDFYWVPDPRDVTRLTGAPIEAPRRAPQSSAEAMTSNIPVAQCPRCQGGMVDQRAIKTKPTQPDWRCKDEGRTGCKGVWWPGEWPAAVRVERTAGKSVPQARPPYVNRN